MDKAVKEIIVDLMTRLWKSESEHFETAFDRNSFKAEMKETYDRLDTLIGVCDKETAEDYEEEIESLEDALGDALSKNEDLTEENWRLKEILKNVSEAVNVTWS